MISTESYSKDWIRRRSDELGYNNKQLLEKVIRAFALLEMLVDAAKAAYLATSFQKGRTDIQKFSRDNDLSTLTVFSDMPKELQRLRRSLPEAFWYWAKTYELL